MKGVLKKAAKRKDVRNRQQSPKRIKPKKRNTTELGSFLDNFDFSKDATITKEQIDDVDTVDIQSKLGGIACWFC